MEVRVVQRWNLIKGLCTSGTSPSGVPAVALLILMQDTKTGSKERQWQGEYASAALRHLLSVGLAAVPSACLILHQSERQRAFRKNECLTVCDCLQTTSGEVKKE